MKSSKNQRTPLILASAVLVAAGIESFGKPAQDAPNPARDADRREAILELELLRTQVESIQSGANPEQLRLRTAEWEKSTSIEREEIRRIRNLERATHPQPRLAGVNATNAPPPPRWRNGTSTNSSIAEAEHYFNDLMEGAFANAAGDAQVNRARLRFDEIMRRPDILHAMARLERELKKITPEGSAAPEALLHSGSPALHRRLAAALRRSTPDGDELREILSQDTPRESEANPIHSLIGEPLDSADLRLKIKDLEAQLNLNPR